MKNLLSAKEVCNRLGISRTTLWRAVKDNRVPPPRKLHPNGDNRWHESEIDAVIGSLPVADAYRNSGRTSEGAEAA